MPLSRTLPALVALAVSLSTAAHAQTDRFPDLWSPDGRIEGMAVLGDTLFVSGRFGRVGPSTGQLAVLDKATGVAGPGYPQFDAIGLGSPGVTAIVPDGAGGYYAGGEFSFVSGQPRRNLARVLPDGTLDPDFRPDPALNPGTPGSADGFVTTLALDRSAASPSGAGVLYVGGRFETVGGQPREDLAALDAATGAVLPLQTEFVQSGVFFGVASVVVSDGVVYVAGSFSAVGGQPRTGLAALDAATGAVLPWGPTLTVGPPSSAPGIGQLALGDSTIYVAGGFDTVNGQPRERLAELTLADPATGEGGVPTPWAPTSGLLDPISAQDLVVVGDDVFAAGTRLARIDRTTAAVTYVAGGLASTRALAYDPEGGPSGQGTLYVGADRRPTPFSSTFPVVVGVDPATGQPTGFDAPGATESNQVNALAVEPGPGGRLFVGGTFITFGTGIAPRQGLAAFSLTTGLPTDFAASVTGPGQGLFEDLALSPDGRFLYGYSNVVGGAALRLTEFDLATGATREFTPQGLTVATYGASAHVAGAEARGSATAAAPNPRVENATSALVVTDTRLCLSINGVACYDRATATRLFYTPMVYVSNLSENNGDLVYLPPGGPVQGPGGAGGTLYLAAPVAEAPPGTSRPALVAVDFETGAVLSQWTPGFDFVGAEGYALALFDRDGDGPAQTALYAGGSREWTVQGTEREALATFDPLTAALGPWAPRVSGGTASVLAMATHRTTDGDGAVYVGGTLFFANGVRGRSVVAFDAVSGVRRPWGEDVPGTPRVLMVSERHGAVFVGGSVGLVGTGHSNLVALTPAAPILPTAGEAGGPESASEASLTVAGPNPFRSRTALALSLPEGGPVEASLFDVLGRRVAVLHDGPLGAGTHTLAVDASQLPAGVYVARVTGASFTEALTLTVVR